MNPEAEQFVDQQIAARAMAEKRQQAATPALRWYLRIVFFMPTMICIALAIITSIVQRLPWIARFQIDGDWLVLGYCIIIGLSTFILGFVHSRLYDARHPDYPRKRGVALWWHAIKFFLMQLLIVPSSITVIAAITALFF